MTDSFVYGVLEALLLPLAFAALGLGWWGAALRAEGAPPIYPLPLVETTPVAEVEPATWLVDGFNVVQVGLLGGEDRSDWWTAERRALLLERAEVFDPSSAAIWVVFDGTTPVAEPDPPQRARIVFAPSADEWLVRRVRAAPDSAALVVVTADRRLAARVRHLGAQVASPAEFLARCRAPSNRGEITTI